MLQQNHRKISMVSVLLIVTIVTLGCAITTPLNKLMNAESNPIPTITPVVEVSRALTVVETADDSLVGLYERVNPSVVNITVYTSQNGQVAPLGQGSGFVYDNAGHIITNAHVAQDANQIDVAFSDGSISAATVVGLDLNSDLAVLTVEKLPEGVGPLPLGDMSELAVGQSVVAVGNPFGLDGTLTRGIISALGRNIPALNQFLIPQSIQTDAAINPGNSGGPLLNMKGEVIGVNAQIETGGISNSNSGVGFAIPVNIIQRVVPDLVEKGKTEWSWMGVVGGDLTPTLVSAMSLPVERGAYISQIAPGGPSESIGLKGSSGEESVDGRAVEVGGDVIIAVNDQKVASFDDLLVYIALNTRPGDKVTLTIVRDGQTKEVGLTLAGRPDDVNL